VAASFQRAVVDSLVDVSRRAIARTGARNVVVTGGVSANRALREAMERMGAEEGAEVLVPPLSRCTDNAAMIAFAGWRRLRRGERDHGR
jgi:N6-L-threonylcarbamoyladenine synthase